MAAFFADCDLDGSGAVNLKELKRKLRLGTDGASAGEGGDGAGAPPAFYKGKAAEAAAAAAEAAAAAVAAAAAAAKRSREMHRLTEQLPALLQRLVAHAPASARVLVHWRGGGAAPGWATELAATAAAALQVKPLSALLGGSSGRPDSQRGGLPLTALVALLRGDNQRKTGVLRTVHVARLSDITADPLAGRMYTCALDEAGVARAFGDCRDPLGSTPPLGGPSGEARGDGDQRGEARPLAADLPAALAPPEAIEALRACAWLLYAEVPVGLLSPAARLHALLDNISGKRSVEQVVAEATRVRAPPRFVPSDASPPLFAGEDAGARHDAVRLWARLELRMLPGFPLWEAELFGLVCTWQHHLRAIYDAYATPLRSGTRRDRSSSTSSGGELLPRGARALPPAAWLALCCGCGLDATLPPPLLAAALQQAVRDVAPGREAGAAAGPLACEPADYFGFVQALVALSHAWAMSRPLTSAAGTMGTAAAAGNTEVLPRCFGALMLDALAPHARQAQPREFRRRMGHETALVTPRLLIGPKRPPFAWRHSSSS